jgi:hypothetical protein
MARRANKTEHSGAKKGSDAYWGGKAEAKLRSNRCRREQDRRLIRQAAEDESGNTEQVE